MSSLLTPEVIYQVVHEVMPHALDLAAKMGDPSRKGCHVVVALSTTKRQGNTFMDSIDYTEPWGEIPEGKPYGEIATKKCELSWFYEMDTNTIMALMPHVCEPGDTKFQGGVWFMEIAVGVSGYAAPIDEMIGRMIASALVAKAQLLVMPLRNDPEQRWFPKTRAA